MSTISLFFFILKFCPLRERWKPSSWKVAWHVARYGDARQIAEALINHVMLVSPLQDIPMVK